MRELLFVVLVLACPLMMVLMMRGHGQGGHAHRVDDGRSHHERERWPELTSTAELLRKRDALDRLIEERESVTPAQAPAMLQEGGDTLYFCSLGCRDQYDRKQAEQAQGSPIEGTPVGYSVPAKRSRKAR